jgi:hypothetical protein
MLLWGKPGCGKTVLASTAPPRRLWLLFDPAGTASLNPSNDDLIVDLSGIEPMRLDTLKQGGVFEADLVKLLRKDDSISTLIVDSLTTLGAMGLSYAILSGKANKGTFKATIEDPGQSGFGVRLAIILDFVQLVMRAAADFNKHVILTCHEKDAKSDKGIVTEITMNLGGQLNNQVGLRISELWYMEDTGRERLLYLRNFGVRRPMRTRMFHLPPDKVSMKWDYNQHTGKGDTIAGWLRAWAEAGYNKLPLGAKAYTPPEDTTSSDT